MKTATQTKHPFKITEASEEDATQINNRKAIGDDAYDAIEIVDAVDMGEVLRKFHAHDELVAASERLFALRSMLRGAVATAYRGLNASQRANLDAINMAMAQAEDALAKAGRRP